MCCAANPNVSAEVGRAKCASIAVIVMAILNVIGGITTLPIGGYVPLAGGVLSLIGSSMLLCCGPSSKGQGKGLHVGGLVLFILTAVIFCASMAVLMATYFGIQNEINKGCGVAHAINTNTGNDPTIHDETNKVCTGVSALVAAIIWPYTIFVAVTAAFNIWASVMCCKAMNAIGQEMAGSQEYVNWR